MHDLISLDCSKYGDFKDYYESLGCNTSDRPYVACELLGITDRTLRRYLADPSSAPAAATRLLWHETHHGRRMLDNKLFNEARFYSNSYTIQSQLVDTLRRKIAALEIENTALKDSAVDSKFISANQSHYLSA
jgi:hypothetical protein